MSSTDNYIAYLCKSLDATFHSDVYAKVTSFGPLKVPSSIINSAQNAVNFAVNKVIDVANAFSEIAGGSISTSQAEQVKDGINSCHFSTKQNWTRSMNSICQAIMGIVLSLFLSNPFLRLGVQLGCVFWMTVGVRHLASVQYSYEAMKKYVNESKFVWS